MNRGKDRLYKALVIGANPAGIAATNKLGELGIPVTLVDTATDLDAKLGAEAWRLPSGMGFNHAYRPGLIRIFRNPLIYPLIPCEVRSIKHTAQGFGVRLKRSPTYCDEAHCVLCGRCVATCPVTFPDGRRPIGPTARRTLPGRMTIAKRQTPPCQQACPLGVDAQGYVAMAGKGRFAEALEIVRRDNVLPGVCGRICTHPCEEVCRRGELDDPVAIRDIKRHLADYGLAHPPQDAPRTPPKGVRRVAVVGSGPSGLAAAADLARLGYKVRVFEREARPGGLLRYAVGPHRLPREILDADIAWVEGLGVEILCNHPVSLSEGLGELRGRYDAVLVAGGAWKDRRLGIPGEDLEGVEGCVSFLTRLHREGPEKAVGVLQEDLGPVAVIGDGNAAFDLARTLRRLGAEVTLLSWFARDEIPADPEEVRGAEEEGVLLEDRLQSVAFLGEDGRVRGIRCVNTEPGPPDDKGICWPVPATEAVPVDLPFGRVFVAIGQKGSLGPGASGLEITAGGLIQVNDAMGTSLEGVFAAGDGVTGPSSVVRAMAAGRAAARSIHRHLSGADLAPLTKRPEEAPYSPIPPEILSQGRPTLPERRPGVRVRDFLEVTQGLGDAQVTMEAGRCLQCGVCSECLACLEACRAIGAIQHTDAEEEILEQVGVVIVADPALSPQVKGEDVLRAYGPASAAQDPHAMTLRGFAAAARALTLLSETSLRLRGRGVSFSPPAPDLSPKLRVGVFVCRCNDSFGWEDRYDRIVNGLHGEKDCVHAEVLPAACTPEGTNHILRAIREKGITRMVLASCVCCPLDFVCSACTDQRSRLKDALFHDTGINRSMVETCNIRGEALSRRPFDPQGAWEAFVGLLRRSLGRVGGLRALPVPSRNYNLTTAVIGGSEAAVSAALTLAETGSEVFMFGTREKPLSEEVKHPRIHCFADSAVTGLRGTLGDFQLSVESPGLFQRMQVGAVILGEKSRRTLPYYPQEGLPPRLVAASMQQKGTPGIPFLYPGKTSIAGLFLANPPNISVSEGKKGAAAGIHAASVTPKGPRLSKGYTVVIAEERCRGCGRCIQVCPYQAVTLRHNALGGWVGCVDEALCKGCGNCISVCPNGAADSPYRNRAYLETLLEEVLSGPGVGSREALLPS